MNLKTVHTALAATLVGSTALAFCGFYAGKADTKLFNESSQVAIARDGNRTILTMTNDYRGDMREFALVVPIPYVFEENQIQVGDALVFERLDAYSAPRLVEYFDGNPCNDRLELEDTVPAAAPEAEGAARALGVAIERQFTVGEYDILILSAAESAGLEAWLLENGYHIPAGAGEVLRRYLRQGMKFFIAKVNLEAFDAGGFQQLRPLVMAFESEHFMLPIQLGMVNAAGPQDLVIYLLSPKGRVELSNYRTVRVPADVNVPEFVAGEFGDVYRAMFQRSYEREGKNAVFLEYAWDMSWCDPCAADPLSPEELRKAGAFWLDETSDALAPNVYLTRLHVRYEAEHFKEDLMFTVTDNRENFQGRYVLQHPYQGELSCEAAQDYVRSVGERREREAQTLANLTGWSIDEIRAKMGRYDPTVPEPRPWWERVFRLFD